jgi:hypothetical protein
VWVGYVRSLCLRDLIDAVPAIAPVVDLVCASIERDNVVRTVRTVYGTLSQEVEVVSVVGLLAACAYLGFDGDVGGTPFWKWAEIFPERLPFEDLDRFRIALPGRCDDIDHAFLRPAPSRGRGANHLFRCGILSHFPSHDWVRLKDGTRPIPDVVFADGEVERHLARIGVIAHVEGRAAAVAAIGALRPLAAWLVEAPTFEGHELLVRVERGAPYLWMGSIEDSTGVEIPVGLVDHAAPPLHGTVDGNLVYFEVDPYVPRMLRRNHRGGRGRSSRTTAWIHLDGVREMIARVRAALLAEAPVRVEGIVLLDRFARVAVDDLDLHYRETVHGAAFGSPTDSGRQVVVDLVADALVLPVVFDPWTRSAWFTQEQLAVILQSSYGAIDALVGRLRKAGLVQERDIRLRLGVGADGRRRNLRYFSWELVLLMASPTSIRRRRALSEWIGFVALRMANRELLADRYLISDFEGSK